MEPVVEVKEEPEEVLPEPELSGPKTKQVRGRCEEEPKTEDFELETDQLPDDEVIQEYYQERRHAMGIGHQDDGDNAPAGLSEESLKTIQAMRGFTDAHSLMQA